jgi:hypothetical protein
MHKFQGGNADGRPLMDLAVNNAGFSLAIHPLRGFQVELGPRTTSSTSARRSDLPGTRSLGLERENEVQI